MLVKLLSTEKREICVNLVMPVIKTRRSYSSSAFKMAKTSRYTSVHASCSGVFQECWSGESYSSMRMATFKPVCLYAVVMMASKRSASSAVGSGVMAYFSS